MKVGKGKCLHCEHDGQWKRNFLEYLQSLKGKWYESLSTCNSSLFLFEMINANGHSPIFFILDSGDTCHISVCMQNLKMNMPLKKQEVVLKVRNRTTLDPLAIGTSSILLFIGHILKPKDYLFIPNTDGIQVWWCR